MELQIHLLTWMEMKAKWPLPSQSRDPDGNGEKGSEWGGGTEGDPCLHWSVLYLMCVLPRQTRPIIWFIEVKACGQMARHMAWALSFRCSVCRATLNKAQVHKLKSWKGPIWKCVSSVTEWFGVWTCVGSTSYHVFQQSVRLSYLNYETNNEVYYSYNHTQHCVQDILYCQVHLAENTAQIFPGAMQHLCVVRFRPQSSLVEVAET